MNDEEIIKKVCKEIYEDEWSTCSADVIDCMERCLEYQRQAWLKEKQELEKQQLKTNRGTPVTPEEFESLILEAYKKDLAKKIEKIKIKYEKKLVLGGQDLTLFGTKTQFLHINDFWDMFEEVLNLLKEERGDCE